MKNYLFWKRVFWKLLEMELELRRKGYAHGFDASEFTRYHRIVRLRGMVARHKKEIIERLKLLVSQK